MCVYACMFVSCMTGCISDASKISYTKLVCQFQLFHVSSRNGIIKQL